MRKALTVTLFLLLVCKTYACTVTGILNDKLLVWNIWEYKNQNLQQYLIFHNKDTTELKIEIRVKDQASSKHYYMYESGDSIYHQVSIKAGEILKIAHPQNNKQPEYLVFFQNRRYIGILSYVSEQPPPFFLDKKYTSYTNTGLNGNRLSYWVRTRSINNSELEMCFVPILYNKGDFMYLKLITEKDSMPHRLEDPSLYPENDSLKNLYSNPDYIKSRHQPLMVLKKRKKKSCVTLPVKQGKEAYPVLLMLVFNFEYNSLKKQNSLCGMGYGTLAVMPSTVFDN